MGRFIAFVAVIFMVLSAAPLYAADAATVIFKSGQVVRINDGFRQIEAELSKVNGKNIDHHNVQLNLGCGALIMNVAEIVVLCRDDCRDVVIAHQLDPKRGKPESEK